jgi:hypothetical protein
MIQVKILKKTPTSLEQDIRSIIIPLAEEHTRKLAVESKAEMDRQIDDARLRTIKPEGFHLKETIQAEKIEGGYGVGNIDTLNEKNKYWAWLNWGIAGTGRTIPPGTKENPKITGHFEPKSGGIFTKGQPKFSMNPKKPIKAINYIEKTIAIIIGKINEILK